MKLNQINPTRLIGIAAEEQTGSLDNIVDIFVGQMNPSNVVAAIVSTEGELTQTKDEVRQLAMIGVKETYKFFEAMTPKHASKLENPNKVSKELKRIFEKVNKEAYVKYEGARQQGTFTSGGVRLSLVAVLGEEMYNCSFGHAGAAYAVYMQKAKDTSSKESVELTSRAVNGPIQIERIGAQPDKSPNIFVRDSFDFEGIILASSLADVPRTLGKIRVSRKGLMTRVLEYPKELAPQEIAEAIVKRERRESPLGYFGNETRGAVYIRLNPGETIFDQDGYYWWAQRLLKKELAGEGVRNQETNQTFNPPITWLTNGTYKKSKSASPPPFPEWDQAIADVEAEDRNSSSTIPVMDGDRSQTLDVLEAYELGEIEVVELGDSGKERTAAVSNASMNKLKDILNEGIRLYKSGDYSSARTYLSLNPHAKLDLAAQVALGLADLQLKADRPGLAKSWAEEALKQDVNSSFAVGQFFYNAGIIDRAEACFKEAYKLDPKNAVAAFNLANIYTDQGKVSLAKSWCGEALKARPNYPKAVELLSRL